MKNPVWRLLRRNISPGQLGGYALANLAGLCIVLVAIQFYRDVNTVFTADDSFIKRDYLVMSKTVTSDLLGLGDDNLNSFSDAELDELKAQPWVRRVGEFTSAEYNVAARMSMGGRGMATALFLESIPDDFFDVRPQGWNDFDPSDSTAVVPIILSKDYLALYNFGFASSRGLPQVSEQMIGTVPLQLSLSGNGVQQNVQARIAGFSSRLNTIAVPEKFMEWANARFGTPSARPSSPSRLIVEVSSPGDPAIETFLSEHGYEVAGDKMDNGKTARFLTIVTLAVVAVGAVITVLSFFILLLSIHLLLQKNRRKMRYLILLGYTTGAVAKHYYIIVTTINAAVLLLACATVVIAQRLWSAPLAEIGVDSASLLPTLVLGVAIVAGITLLNILSINRNIHKIS